MPYQSQAQQGLFHSPNSPVGPAEVAKWDAESKGQTGLPHHVGDKPVKWMQRAVKHPGIEKRAAARAGESTHQYLEGHKDAPGKAGQRARLGLTFERMAGRAFGGPVAANKPYFVGEKGPELMIPRTAGRIIPHSPHLPRLPLQPHQAMLHDAIMRGMGGIENIPSKLPGPAGTT